MSTSFNNAKITHIVTFDLTLPSHDLTERSINNAIFFGDVASISMESLNSEVYDREYLEKTPKILTFRLDFDLFSFINPALENEMNITVCFGQNGINSARFDFNLTYPVMTPELIKISDETGEWVDSFIFHLLKSKIISLLIIPAQKPLLNVHSTYSVVTSTDTEISSIIIEKEIFGIIWNNKHYRMVHDDLVSKVMENSIPIYRNDIITIAEPAALMIFQGKNLNYVNERINAVEMHQRQKYLLKKIDFQLDSIISRVKEKEKINLKSAIGEIENTQIEIQSALEIYRNTRISATTSFILLFDLLNDVFRLNNQYKFIQEKLNACEKIYEGLHSEQRNNLMERIEWIVLILGVESLILLFLTDVIYGGKVSSQYQIEIIILSIIISTLILILIIFLFKNYKYIYFWLITKLKDRNDDG
ncbi:MAG: hypothetical protein Q7V10_00870 [Methanobacteriaceae archaeon]|nr:hypothetical protein [Methanobacteriaceae archaeon]MDO9628025.1 hypothetical protein [Methanobacteriaceae archaeon]